MLGLVEQVVTGKVIIGRSMTHDCHLREAWKALMKMVPAEAKTLQGRRSASGDQQVGCTKKGIQPGSAFRVFEIELVNFDPFVEAAVPFGAGVFKRVAGRRLDLADCGSQGT
jgi:hypothetical protein